MQLLILKDAMKKITSLLFLFCIVWVSNAFTTIMIKQFSVEEMTHRSDTVVLGVVKNVEYKMNDRNQLFTFVTIETTDVLKGDTENTEFEIIEIGGKTEKYTTAVYGAPTYIQSEEVLLFLRDHIEKVDLKRVVGLKLGKYSVVEDSQTGNKFAVTDLNEIHFAEPPTDTESDNESDTHADSHGKEGIRIPLDEMITQIQAAVAEETPAQTEANMSLHKAQKEFDWMTWLKKQIVRYANKMGAVYKTYTINDQRS